MVPAQFETGITLSSTPGADPVSEARHAEALGFDVVTVHRDVLNGPPPSFETWTLLGWVAAHTTRVRVAPNVLVLPNRHPSVVAKMAETLDRLSRGRLILALGSGAAMNDGAVRALGLQHRSARQKLAAIEEAVDVIRGLWEVPGFSYAGDHFGTEAALVESEESGGAGAALSAVCGNVVSAWVQCDGPLRPGRSQPKRKPAYFHQF